MLHRAAAAAVPTAAAAAAAAAVAAAPGAGEFNDKAALNAAVKEWAADASSAEAKHGHVSGWDTSRVTTMYPILDGAATFNGDISKWDTSQVTTMAKTFDNAAAFNSELAWDTSKVTNI